jgi:hypothetical protein
MTRSPAFFTTVLITTSTLLTGCLSVGSDTAPTHDLPESELAAGIADAVTVYGISSLKPGGNIIDRPTIDWALIVSNVFRRIHQDDGSSRITQ